MLLGNKPSTEGELPDFYKWLRGSATAYTV